MNEAEFDLLPEDLKKEGSVVFTRHQSVKNPNAADTSDEDEVDAEHEKEIEKAKEEQKAALALCDEI